MKKYCYIPTGNQVWIDSAIDLYKRGIAEPVLWLGDDCHYQKAREVFGEAVVRKQDFVFYPERVQGINYSGENSDFFLSENYQRAKDRCFKMMDRLDLYGTFARLDRDVLFDKLSMWALKQIEDSKPDALVTSETPHSYTQYLIYEIFLYLDIEIVKFNTWNIVPILSMKNVRTGQRQKHNMAIDESISKAMDSDIINYVESLKNRDSYELSYMKRQRLKLNFKNSIIRFFRSGYLVLIKEHWFQFRMNFNHHYYPINPYKLGMLVRFKIQRLRKKNLLKEFKKIQRTVDLENKYVYFALHFEPERSTNPDGGHFQDQTIALIKLRELLPDDIDIFVKEHPSQFLNAGKGSRGRSPIFYNILDNISGVRLVSENTNSLDLIKNSVFMATITGSAAFESAIMEKQALIFGDAWFDNCPNVIPWSNEISFESIVERKISSSDEIINFLLSERRLYTVPGCINVSAQMRHSEYIDDNFSRVELKGLVHFLENFFTKL